MKEDKPKTIWQMQDMEGNRLSYSHPTYGLFWKWGILFENGDKGVFNVKDGNQPRFNIGELASYTIEPTRGDHPHKVTFKDPQYTEQQTQEFGPPKLDEIETAIAKKVFQDKGSDRGRLIIRQCCIKAAAEYTAQRSTPQTISWEAVADNMFDWVMKSEAEEREEAKEIVKTGLGLDDTDEPPF